MTHWHQPGCSNSPVSNPRRVRRWWWTKSPSELRQPPSIPDEADGEKKVIKIQYWSYKYWYGKLWYNMVNIDLKNINIVDIMLQYNNINSIMYHYHWNEHSCISLRLWTSNYEIPIIFSYYLINTKLKSIIRNCYHSLVAVRKKKASTNSKPKRFLQNLNTGQFVLEVSRHERWETRQQHPCYHHHCSFGLWINYVNNYYLSCYLIDHYYLIFYLYNH